MMWLRVRDCLHTVFSTAGRGPVTEQLQVAYQALGEDAKRVKPAPRLFPAMYQGNEDKLFTFLSASAVGRKSLISAVFEGIPERLFRNKIEKFAQRIADSVCAGKFVVSVKTETGAASAEATRLSQASPPVSEQSPPTRVGDKSQPTLQGYYYEFRKHPKMPYVLRNANHPNLGVLCECRSKVDAEHKVSTYEREAVTSEQKTGCAP